MKIISNVNIRPLGIEGLLRKGINGQQKKQGSIRKEIGLRHAMLSSISSRHEVGHGHGTSIMMDFFCL